jgi:hypothetical protein
MYCFLLQIFMFQLSSTSIYGLHTKHAIPSNACLDPLETSEAHCAPRYIFNALHFNNEHRRTPSTLWQMGEKKGDKTILILCQISN